MRSEVFFALFLLGAVSAAVTSAWGQSFMVDVDYQIQRQYKAPFLRHEVFTNAFELESYVGGGFIRRR